MFRTYLKALLATALTISGLMSTGSAQAKRNGSALTEPCPDQRTYTGSYRNLVYGFTFVIPLGLKGYWNSARCAPDEQYGCFCMGDHGRFISLANDAGIDAFVGYQMEPEWTVRQYEAEARSDIKKQQGVHQVKVLDSRRILLGKLSARRFAVKYVEKNRSLVIDHIIALHKGVEYELILRTPADRYRRDKKVLEKITASWRLTPRL